MSVTPVQSSSEQRTLPAILKWGDQQQEVVALINPGAEENFLDSCFVAQWGLSTIELNSDGYQVVYALFRTHGIKSRIIIFQIFQNLAYDWLIVK